MQPCGIIFVWKLYVRLKILERFHYSNRTRTRWTRWSTPHWNLDSVIIHDELEGGVAGATRTVDEGGEAGPQELPELRIVIWNKDLK